MLTIISGGQTGADRAALDFGMANGFPVGGWCPKYRRAEDGRVPDRYPLKETLMAGYRARTYKNVLDSDGTVIMTLEAALTKGSLYTFYTAELNRKPVLCLSRFLDEPPSAAERLSFFLDKYQIKILNVAGSRSSKEPRIAEYVQEVLARALLPVPT